MPCGDAPRAEMRSGMMGAGMLGSGMMQAGCGGMDALFGTRVERMLNLTT
jgi:hypothetical protein